MFKYDFKFEIGDNVYANIRNIKGVIKDRKLDFYDDGTSQTIKENYLVAYNQSSTMWFNVCQLERSSELDNEHYILSVIIDANLLSRNFDLVDQFRRERETLG